MNFTRIKNHFFAIPKLVSVFIGVALCINTLGLLFIFTHYNQDVMVAGDAIGYHELAKNLNAGLDFGIERDGVFVPETFRTPGLPFLFSLFLAVGLGFKTYFAVISFLSAIIIPLSGWYIGKKLFNANVGIITAGLLAIEPLIIICNWAFITEIPFLISTLLGCVFTIKAYEKNEFLSYYGIIAGLLFALATYIRPAVFPLLVLSLTAVCIERSLVRKKIASSLLFVLFITFVCLTPWYERMHELTGVYALSGTGWRNVYTDYLASIRAINNNTTFIAEKEALKQYAMQTWGITRYEINSPAQSERLKDYAIPEILANKSTVIKLQSVLFISYFTNADYQRRFQKLGILPMNVEEKGRVSSSRLVLDQGFGAIPEIYAEMKNRYFLPIIERAWTVSIFLFAVLGFFVTKSRARYLVFLLLVFGYLTSSAIGLGVESRLRLPILPFYFMLASCGILFALQQYKKVIILWKK